MSKLVDRNLIVRDQELVEVFDSCGDFLFSATSEQEIEQLCRNARELGFNPILKDEIGGNGYDDE